MHWIHSMLWEINLFYENLDCFILRITFESYWTLSELHEISVNELAYTKEYLDKVLTELKASKEQESNHNTIYDLGHPIHENENKKGWTMEHQGSRRQARNVSRLERYIQKKRFHRNVRGSWN